MLKILIADDSAMVRRLVKTALCERDGWTICGEAVDGQQAVSLAQEIKPDLIVLDLAMPGLDGFQASEQILQESPSVPIVLYTLHNFRYVEAQAKKIGIRAVISKFTDTEVLCEIVKQLSSSLDGGKGLSREKKAGL